MHVRRTQRDVAQGRRLESELHQRIVADRRAASTIGGRGPDIVELIVGKPPAAMAGRAQSFAVIERKSALGRIRDRRLFARNPKVERRGLGLDRAFELRDGAY